MRTVFHMGTLRGAGSARLGKLLLQGFEATRPDLWARASVWTPPGWDEPSLGGVAAHHIMRPGVFGKLAAENIGLRADLSKAKALMSFGDTSLIQRGKPHVLLVQQAYLVSNLRALDFHLPASWYVKMAAMQHYFAFGARFVSALAVQTRFMKQRLCAHYDIDPSRVHVVGSPLLLPVPRADAPREGRLVVCVSGEGPHKNLALLPPMLKALNGVVPGVVCALTLNRAQARPVAELAERLGVTAQLRFVGRLPYADCIDLMWRAAACVLPSRLESFCYPLHEALALGRPVVVSDRPFAREATAHATFANPDDPLSFADAVAKALTNPPIDAPQTPLSPKDAAHRYWEILQKVLQES